MPTDFVFVDLSPVKNEDDESSKSSSESSVSSMESPILDLPNDSISSISSEDCDSIFSSLNVDVNDSAFGNNDTFPYMQENIHQNQNYADSTKFPSESSLPSPVTSDASVFDQNVNFGLGIFNVDFENFHQPQRPQPQPQQNNNWMMQQFAFQQFLQYQSQFNQPQYPQQYQPASPDVRRTKSTSSTPMKKQRSSSGYQFKTYKGPNSSVKKPIHHNTKPHQRTFSAPTVLSPKTPNSCILDDYMMLNKESLDNYNFAESTNNVQTYTPVSDHSEEFEMLHKPIKMDDSLFNQNVDDFLIDRREFDLNAFISI